MNFVVGSHRKGISNPLYPGVLLTFSAEGQLLVTGGKMF